MALFLRSSLKTVKPQSVASLSTLSTGEKDFKLFKLNKDLQDLRTASSIVPFASSLPFDRGGRAGLGLPLPMGQSQWICQHLWLWEV